MSIPLWSVSITDATSTPVPGRWLHRLEVDRTFQLRAERLHDADEAISIVVGGGDVVATPKFTHFIARDELAELGLERATRALEGVAVGLTQRVEVQAMEAGRGPLR